MGAKRGWKIIEPLALKTKKKNTSYEILHKLKDSDNLAHFLRVFKSA
jgi:hypothetical protein